jgi:Raf kinase inhibitor-like YbhB/YbcL family protein
MHGRRLRAWSARALVVCTAFAAAYHGREQKGFSAVTLRLSSSSFDEGADIPAKHTCEGGDISPALSWSGIPPGTKSLAIVVDDPDAPDPRAPKMTWVHWVLYDIPADVAGLGEGATDPPGARAGRNDWKSTGFRGPCPPVGRHRYVHKLYALDTVLPDLGKPDKAKLEGAMKGHVLGEATLVGSYEKNKKGR